MTSATCYGAGIYAIDADYQRARLAAIHLIVEDGRAAFIDTGCNSSLPAALAALAAAGVAPENVDYVILTHVHLDHAGGTGAMMQAFPNARLVVHPRGARHMIDPSALVAGTVGVYGEEATERLYGKILPVPAERVIEATDGLAVSLAGRELVSLDTPGHARHHNAILDRGSGQIFSGDAFGISYPELDIGERQFIFPTTTPVQFDPPAMHESIERLLSFEPPAMYLTHFGQLRDPAGQAETLHRQVDAFAAAALAEKDSDEQRQQRIRARLAGILIDEARRFGSTLASETIVDVFANDLTLNAQGVECWVDRQ